MIWPIKQNDNILASKSILKHGFKAKAERLAKEYREQLSIHPCAPLCAFKLATHLQVPVYDIQEFDLTPKEISILSGSNGINSAWSALTMPTEKGNRIIIHNTFHSSARQQSNVMHEIAHIICNHEITTTDFDFEIPDEMRVYNELYEEEAKWLGATLQLAAPCLLWSKKRNMSNEEIANHFNASLEMVNYRMNTTGIAKIPK